MSLPQAPSSPNKLYHTEKRRSILPSTNLLQVKETEEESFSVRSINSRISTASYDSALSSMSGRSDNSLDGLFSNDSIERGQIKCAGYVSLTSVVMYT
jgi:hypothetical protein